MRMMAGKNVLRSLKMSSVMEMKFDYRKPEELKRYLDKQGRIKPRRKTKLPAEEQRQMVIAVKRARHLALL